MDFWKYCGAGNDFILMEENSSNSISSSKIIKLCDRRFGIGADGVLLVKRASGPSDFSMQYMNADGGEVEMCGNGARACVHWFATRNKKSKVHFKTSSGADYQGELLADGRAQVSMNEVSDEEKISLTDLLQVQDSFYINTGVPHSVFILNELQNLNDAQWMELAPKIRHDQRFERGVNVNFVKLKSDGAVDMRTFERGVEAETLACGTGAVAVARYFLKKYKWTELKLHVAGGLLEVCFKDKSCWLAGPVEQVFTGQVN